MALPLIAALGAGVLGGGRYLLNKADERQAANTRSGLESFLASSALPQAEQFGILNAMQVDQQNNTGFGGFMDTGMNRRAQSMLDYAMQQDARYRQQAAQSAQANQQGMQDRAFQLSNQHSQLYNKNLQDFGLLQDTYRKGITALEANDPANVLASQFNFYNLVEPGGIVRDSESGQYRAVGGGTEQVVNALNKIIGEGLTDTTRRQLQGAMRNQYMGRKVRADRQREGFQRQRDAWQRAGYQVSNPEGILGIDWDLGSQTFNTPAQQAPAKAAATIQEERERLAQSRGRTTVNPNKKRRVSVREARGRGR